MVPEKWTMARVAFIPKPGKKADHTPKAFRPISLSSFLLKTMEKILDQHIREDYLKNSPLHTEQYAYQPGKSTETAIHCLTSKIEKALEGKEIALCLSIDIHGAFDNATHESIEDGMIRKNIPQMIIKWTLNMLKSRTVIYETPSKQQKVVPKAAYYRPCYGC